MEWIKKHKINSGVIIFFIVVGVVSAASSGKNGKNESENKFESKTSSSDQKKQGDVTPKVGDITKLGEREFTVNSVRRSGAFDYNTPKSGKEFVIVNVTIRNLGDNEVSYNPFDFKVQD